MAGDGRDDSVVNRISWFKALKSQAEIPPRDVSASGRSLWQTLQPPRNHSSILDGKRINWQTLTVSVALVIFLSSAAILFIFRGNSIAEGIPGIAPLGATLLQYVFGLPLLLALGWIGVSKAKHRFQPESVQATLRNQGVSTAEGDFKHLVGISESFPRRVIDPLVNLHGNSIRFPAVEDPQRTRAAYRDVVEHADSILIFRFEDSGRSSVFDTGLFATQFLEQSGENGLPFGTIEAAFEQEPFDLAIDIAISSLPEDSNSIPRRTDPDETQRVEGGRLQREIDQFFEDTPTESGYFVVEISIAGRTDAHHSTEALEEYLGGFIAPFEPLLSGRIRPRLVSADDSDSHDSELVEEKQRMLSAIRAISLDNQRSQISPFSAARRGYPATVEEIPYFLLRPGDGGGTERSPRDQMPTSSIPETSHHVIRQNEPEPDHHSDDNI